MTYFRDRMFPPVSALDDATRDRIATVVDFVMEALGAEFAARLDAISEGPEESHLQADAVMLEFARALAPNVAEAWGRCKARTGGWWYA